MSRWSCPDSTLIHPATQPLDEWLQAKRHGIGGGDIAALTGTGIYDNQTPWFVWDSKVNGSPGPADNPAMQRGRTLEPVVVELFTKDTGIKTRRAGMHRSKLHPCMHANIDRLTEDGGILECKTTTSHGIRKAAELYGRGNPPEYQVMQCRHYMPCPGAVTHGSQPS